MNPFCEHCDGTGIEPIETSEYPPESCSVCVPVHYVLNIHTYFGQSVANSAEHVPSDSEPTDTAYRTSAEGTSRSR
jgi:hypothetical protein